MCLFECGVVFLAGWRGGEGAELGGKGPEVDASRNIFYLRSKLNADACTFHDADARKVVFCDVVFYVKATMALDSKKYECWYSRKLYSWYAVYIITYCGCNYISGMNFFKAA